MKVCETCGKELKSTDIYKTNGFIQCRDCAIKGVYKNDNSDERNQNLVAFNMDESNFSNPWISGMKFLTVLMFIILIIAGSIGAVIIGKFNDSIILGIVAFAGFLVASFAAVAFQMIFIHLAEDVSVIRKTLTQNKKDK